MKLGMMMDERSSAEKRAMGFEAIQYFFARGEDGDLHDHSDATIREALGTPPLALAAMTAEIALVDNQGMIPWEVARFIRLVGRTAGLRKYFGDNSKPILVWHPSRYPENEKTDDDMIFKGLVTALRSICTAAEKADVHIAVEMTRAASVGSAETYLRLKDHVASPALKVCLDAANIVPDRTPLVRCVRMLADDIVIAHGKDCHFNTDGTVAGYGPVGTGKIDYAAYIGALKDYCDIPYFVLEYYRTTEDLLRARDIILKYM